MGRLLLATLTACALGGCIDWGSLYDEPPDGGDTGDRDAAEEHDAQPNPLGCSDGTAEVLLSVDGLTACAGAWTVPGVVVDSEPTCDRAAGNDGINRSGEGCSVSDLCAPGWHVCRDAGDVAVHGGEAACQRLTPPDPEGVPFIFLTRQRGSGDEATCSPDGSEDQADDAWGCGTLGLDAPDCRPLDRHLAILEDGGGCADPFDCGEDPLLEGQNITKREPEQGGGVLCCSDLDP
jgi:hypothetical protein